MTAAVDGLSDMGVPGSDIAVVSQGPGPMAKIAVGAVVGAAIGAAAGLLVDFVVPGLGPLFGLAWLIPF